jgi:phytanoyl-CoA hydroxylase
MPDARPEATHFHLGDTVTEAQRGFLDEHGFIVFRGVVRPDEIAVLMAELDRVNDRWAAEGKTSHFGIPIVWGRDPSGRPYVQRFCFTSLFSEAWHDFVHDARFAPLRALIGDTVRIGDREKDGVVVNRYLRAPGSVATDLGWHTDGLRDLFYGRLPARMLNVGVHFDRCTAAEGGLRLIPGTHRQGVASMCFRKLYFLSHAPDPAEVVIATEPGDVTVHDGRLWHRVARARVEGTASVRRTMYVPYLTDPVVELKHAGSLTPAYHRLGVALRRLRVLGR